MKTQKIIKKTLLVATIAVMMTITIKLSAQNAGRESVPASTENITNNDVKEQKNVRDYCRHEWSFWGAGGISTFNAGLNFGEIKHNIGGNIGLGYSFHFNKHLSILAGAEIAMYNSEMIVDELTDVIDNITDPDIKPIKYVVELEHYMEQDKYYALTLPLMFQLKTPISENGHEFFASFGVKAGFPVKMQYNIKDAEFATYGYYNDYNQWLFDQTDLGYGNQKGKTKQLQINTKWSLTGTFETGIKWKLNSPRLSLYTGVYLDYGFSEIRKDNADKRFLEYDPEHPERIVLNSILTSEYSNRGAGLEKFTDKVSTIALGMKIRLGITTCHVDKDYKNNKKYNSYETDYSYYPNNDNYANGGNDDSYRKGLRDAYTDVIDNLLRSLESPKSNGNGATGKEKPSKHAQNQTDEQYNDEDPLVQAEMRRATKEYGKLVEVFVLHVDGYEVNQTELSVLMELMIDDKIAQLEEYNSDKYVIICEGHTCDLSDDTYNNKLALKRAEAVKNYLVKNGFNAKNIVTVSKGKSTPIVQNTSEYNRKLNRRVVFLIKERK